MKPFTTSLTKPLRQSSAKHNIASKIGLQRTSQNFFAREEVEDVEGGGGGVSWFCGGMEGGSVVANRVWSENWLPTNCCLGAGGGGSYKNITEPYGGIGKFYRDITKILPPPSPPLFHVINIELSLNNPGVYRIGQP